jgi:hypothetical protein
MSELRLFPGEFKKEYPDAKVYAVLDALPKLEGINVDGGTSCLLAFLPCAV